MEQGRLLSGVLLAAMLGSVALAGGPLGPPMSVLTPEQWTIDAGYYHEELGLSGCAEVREHYREWDFGSGPDDPNAGWDDWELLDVWDQTVSLEDLKINAYMASLEYGLCENWDLIVRLGATSAKGDVVGAETYWNWDYDPNRPDYDGEWVTDVWRDSLDFGTGFAWQIGTAFTICQSGRWTWGGRMQFGMADAGSGSASYSETSVEEEDGYEYVYHEDEVVTGDLSWWQAVAYIGPSYQVNETLQLYAAGGWQTLRATLDVTCLTTATESYIYGEDEEEVLYLEEYRDSGSYKLKHASPIGVFGAAWTPRDNLSLAVDVLIGDSGKWGVGVSGAWALN